MKTPEQYWNNSKEREAMRHGHATFSRTRFGGTDEQIKVLEAAGIAALKSMREDHEKELKSIEQSLERIESSLYAADPTLEDVCIKDIRGQILELLTQFRKG